MNPHANDSAAGRVLPNSTAEWTANPLLPAQPNEHGEYVGTGRTDDEIFAHIVRETRQHRIEAEAFYADVNAEMAKVPVAREPGQTGQSVAVYHRDQVASKTAAEIAQVS